MACRRPNVHVVPRRCRRSAVAGTSVTIDTRRFERRLSVAPDKIKRVVRNVLNDTARELRCNTPEIIDHAIDKPVPFTKRSSAVLYRGATYQSLSASLQIAPLQAAYLSPGEFGRTSEQIQTPIRHDAIDQRGNLKKRFRWSPAERSKLAAQVHRVPCKRGGSRSFPERGKRNSTAEP